MKKALCCFSLLMIIMALVGGMAWAADCPSCGGTATGVGEGMGTMLDSYGTPLRYAVGTTGVLPIFAHDYDAVGTNSVADTTVPSVTSASGWSLGLDEYVNNCWEVKQYYKRRSTKGTESFSWSADDNARCGTNGNDPTFTHTVSIEWVGTNAITGPTTVYKDDCITLTTSSDPSGFNSKIRWYIRTGNAIDGYTYSNPSIGSGATLTYTCSTVGKITFVAVIAPFVYEMNCVYWPGNADDQNFAGAETFTVDVLPLPTSNPEGTKCETTGGGSGGCSTGTCGDSGDGGGDVSIQWRRPRVDPPNISVGGIGKDPAGQLCGDTQPSFMIVKSCNTLKWYFTSCEGADKIVGFPQKTTTEDTSLNPSIVTIGNWTLTRIGPSNASSWTYTAKDSDGTLYTFGSGPSTDENERISYPKLSRIDYPDNKYETFTADNPSGLTRIQYAPNGTIISTTEYDVDTNNRITSISGDDGNTTVVGYVEGSTTSGFPATIQLKDPSNNVLSTTTYTYNDDGRISQIDQNGKQTGYAYTKDSSGNVTDITVTNISASPQIVTQYTYGATTTTITQKHPTDSSKDQSTTTEFFIHNGEKTYVWKTTDPMGNVNRIGIYIPSGTTVTNKTQNDDYIFTTNPMLYGQPFKSVDLNGNVTQYAYNSSTGTVSIITYPDNTTETYTYYSDSSGNPTAYPRTVKNRRGNYTHYVRSTATLYRVDAIKTSEPVGGVEPSNWSSITADKEYTYYPSTDSHGQGGRVATESVPNVDGTTAQVTSYIYYETVNGNEKLRNGNTRTCYQYWNGSAYEDKYSYTSYDEAGRTLSLTDANNKSTYYTYDAKGRQLKTIYQNNPEIADESSYTCCNLQWTKDSDGRETHYAYDNAGRVTKIWTNITGQSETNPLITYVYDDFGKKSSFTTYSDDSTGRITSYSYNKQNRVTKIDYPGVLGDEEFGYTNTGQVQWKKDGDNYVTLYRYDTYYRLTNVYYNYTGSLANISYPGTADITYSYLNGTSMKSSVVDSTGTSSYGYDYKGRLISYTPPKPSGHGAITYTYNSLGQKTSQTNGSFVVNYAYYANGWLKDVKKGANLISSYTYDHVGNRVRVDYGNGTYQTYTLNSTDPRYQLDKIQYAYRCAAGQPIQIQGGIGLTRDNSGNPLTWSALDTSQNRIYSKVFSYDQMSRLDSTNYPSKGATDFQYDWVGNRTNPNTMEYNASDQLTRWSGEHRYEYDGRGNLIYEKSDAGTTQKTYAYTYSNLTSSITYAGVNKSSLMTWDAEGNRITFQSSTRTNDSDTFTFVYDPTSGIPAVVEETTPSGTYYYIREPVGELVARISSSGESETMQYYHFDELGSTQFITGSDGTVTDKYTYDAWGNVLSHVGNTQQPYMYVGSMGYYSHYNDGNLPYIQTGVRLYNAECGRYMQLDPIMLAGGLNLYRYAADNSMTNIDPSGLKPMGFFEKAYFCSQELLCYEAAVQSMIAVPMLVLRLAGLVGCAVAGPGYPECELVVQGLITVAHKTMSIAAGVTGAIYFGICMSQDCPQPYCQKALDEIKNKIEAMKIKYLKKIDDAVARWRKKGL